MTLPIPHQAMRAALAMYNQDANNGLRCPY
jgi:hypothetical protein